MPLIIHHPDSPFKGKHYPYPVELIDIYPTITDLLSLKFNYDDIPCKRIDDKQPYKCHDLQGKSLARVVLGHRLYKTTILNTTNYNNNLYRGTQSMKRESSLNGTFTDLQVIPLKNLRRNLVAVDDDKNKRILNHYYKQQDLKSLSTVPSIITDFFNRNNYFYLSSISYAGNQNDSNVSMPHKLHRKRNLRVMMWSNLTKSYKFIPIMDPRMPKLEMRFAISQMWRCGFKDQVETIANWTKRSIVDRQGDRPRARWLDCDRTTNPEDQVSVMGYSLRTIDWRFTVWFHYNRHLCIPIIDIAPFDEEVSRIVYS